MAAGTGGSAVSPRPWISAPARSTRSWIQRPDLDVHLAVTLGSRVVRPRLGRSFARSLAPSSTEGIMRAQRMQRIMKGSALVAVLATLLVGCSGSGGVSTEDAQRWATVKTVSAVYTHLLQFVVQGESSIRSLSASRPETLQGRHALSGAQVSWQNVLAQATNFTTDQGRVVTSLGPTVTAIREAAIAWLNALSSAKQMVARGKAPTFGRIAPLFTQARTLEAEVRANMNATAAQIAGLACGLESRYPALAGGGSAATDCAAATQLSAP